MIMFQFLHLGKDYPKGADYFHTKLKAAFLRHKDVVDAKEMEILIARGQYIVKELEALYSLRKYRTLRKRYYENWATNLSVIHMERMQAIGLIYLLTIGLPKQENRSNCSLPFSYNGEHWLYRFKKKSYLTFELGLYSFRVEKRSST